MNDPVVVVGGGHNGLICAAYLARAGIDTVLVEARDEVGGCASTVSDLGARFNICNCDHTMIRAMPVIDELELGAHGLAYLEPEAGFVNVFHDDAPPWASFHDIDRQLDSLAATYPAQVNGYRRYLEDAMPVAELVLAMARTRPSAAGMAGTALRLRAAGAARLLEWSRRSADEVFARYFDDWHVTMPVVSTGPTVWGAHPSWPGTGLAAAAFATRHLIKTGRPVGGSGALTDAIAASFAAAGGVVRCNARVERLLVDDGSVRGVELTDGTVLETATVVAACDPQRVFVDWVGEIPAGARRLVQRWRGQEVHDGYESKVDAVLESLPRYRFAEAIEAACPGVDVLEPTMIVSPSPEDLDDAHAGRPEGRVATRPTMLVNVPSVLDTSMTPEGGGHVLSLEVLFTPYGLRGGWPTSDEPARWLGLWSEMTESTTNDDIRAWRAMTPDRYEAEFAMHRGHTPSYAGAPLAALFGRQRELTRYRTPIDGLYLSGAGTFPGAGVFGAAGRNTADVVRQDLTGALGRAATPVRRRARRLAATIGR